MEDKTELTEKLKALETEVNNDKIDLQSINSKLEISYKYQDELLQRMEWAKNQTKELRNQFFQKGQEISQKFDKMKNVVDVFTGNFFKH